MDDGAGGRYRIVAIDRTAMVLERVEDGERLRAGVTREVPVRAGRGHISMRKSAVAAMLLAAAVVVSGCASVQAFRQGATAAREGNCGSFAGGGEILR